jgi:hypothetical protein
MEDNKLKFVVHGRKEGDKFVLEGITNYILQKLDSFDNKTIIVTFEIPVPTNTINFDTGNLFNSLYLKINNK